MTSAEPLIPTPRPARRPRVALAALAVVGVLALAGALFSSSTRARQTLAASFDGAVPAPAPVAAQDDQFGPTCPTCIDWSDDDQWPINDEATVQPMASDTTAPADGAAADADNASLPSR